MPCSHTPDISTKNARNARKLRGLMMMTAPRSGIYVIIQYLLGIWGVHGGPLWPTAYIRCRRASKAKTYGWATYTSHFEHL